jgi:hypothetical protein
MDIEAVDYGNDWKKRAFFWEGVFLLKKNIRIMKGGL